MLYHSEDSGNKSLMQQYNMTVPKRLKLKVGAPVVLMANLTDTLVNGCRGKVVKASISTVTVKFSNETAVVQRYTFAIRDKDSREVAWRNQLPLKLAYAFTVHKAQGMTLDEVFIDAVNMKVPGQLGVALGRCVDRSGVKVANFDPKRVTPQPTYITDFYQLPNTPPATNITDCCRKVIDVVDVISQNTSTCIPEILSHSACDSEEEEADVPALTVGIANELDSLVLNSLAVLKYSEAVTRNQQAVNNAVEFLNEEAQRESRSSFVTKLWHELTIISDATFSLSEVSNKDTTSVYRAIHAHTTSIGYKRRVYKLFHGFDYSAAPDSIFRVAYDMVEQLRKEKISKAVKELVSHSQIIVQQLSSPSSHTDNHSAAVVRYIAGWCINKLLRAKRALVRRNIDNDQGLDVLSEARAELAVLEGVLSDDLPTDDPTLSEIIRKQYFAGALKVVDDNAFKFFQLLDQTIQSLETMANCNSHGGQLYCYISETLMSDPVLRQTWSDVSASADESLNLRLYSSVLERYVMLSAGHFVRSFKENAKVKRKFEHRKQIHVASTSASSSTSKKKPKKLNYPCGICGNECITGTVLCESCDKWHHYRCLGLKGTESELDDDAPPYICPKCIS